VNIEYSQSEPWSLDVGSNPGFTIKLDGKMDRLLAEKSNKKLKQSNRLNQTKKLKKTIWKVTETLYCIILKKKCSSVSQCWTLLPYSPLIETSEVGGRLSRAERRRAGRQRADGPLIERWRRRRLLINFLSCVATVVFCVRFEPIKVITLETQLYAVNARWKQLSQLSLTNKKNYDMNKSKKM